MQTASHTLVLFKASTHGKLQTVFFAFISVAIESLSQRTPQLQPQGTSVSRMWPSPFKCVAAQKENRCVTLQLVTWSVVYLKLL